MCSLVSHRASSASFQRVYVNTGFFLSSFHLWLKRLNMLKRFLTSQRPNWKFRCANGFIYLLLVNSRLTCSKTRRTLRCTRNIWISARAIFSWSRSISSRNSRKSPSIEPKPFRSMISSSFTRKRNCKREKSMKYSYHLEPISAPDCSATTAAATRTRRQIANGTIGQSIDVYIRLISIPFDVIPDGWLWHNSKPLTPA